MGDIQVGRSDYKRGVAKEPFIDLKNRFFEYNPVLNATEDLPALISRPAVHKFLEVGTGHIRDVYSEPGTFDNAAFVVSGTDLYRVETDGTSSLIGTISSADTNSVTMAATANIGEGEVPEYLFLTEGNVLWVYSENGGAIGTLTVAIAAGIANNDVVVIDGVYYQFTTGSVDAGTPAGTVGNPWLVNRVGVNITDLQALFDALNLSGVAGTDYSTDIVEHPTVSGYQITANDMFVAAKTAGTVGNAITTTETGANISWGAATLENGGDPLLRQVATPADVGAISLAHINSYVIVVPAQGNNVNGRFYWIEPGETVIDPLNFATAERAPDAINQALSSSDRFWLFGQITTEAWVTTGNIDAPMQRFAGVLFDRGAWEGSAVRVNNGMIVVDQYGGVFEITGGERRISRPDIEERIRLSMQKE